MDKIVFAYRCLLLIGLFMIAFTSPAQVTYDFTTNNKKALKYYKTAEKNYRLLEYQSAEENLLRSLQKDPHFIEAFLLLGDLYMETNRQQEAIKAFERAIAIDSSFFNTVYYLLGDLYYSTHDYKRAIDCLSHYLKIPDLPMALYRKGLNKLERAEFAFEVFHQPVPFNPVNLGDSINSKEDEYINAITADRGMLLFTRRVATDTIAGQAQFKESIFESSGQEDIWTGAVTMESVINDFENIGAVTLSPDGRHLFFTACHAPRGRGSCDLYYSLRMGEGWSKPFNLGEKVNSRFWESQPAFSSDGHTLYFASNRPGGKGSSDIWKTVLQDDGSWSIPVNLGSPVNTSGEEMAPFIHPDDHSLYFSSDGHMGLGGLDLFYARKDSLGLWLKPINLGYPINTEADEINIIIETSGNRAFISSDKLGGIGRYDIYEFELHDKVKPMPVTYMKGRVFDAETLKQLQARFQLIDLESGLTRVEAWSDETTGEFLLILPADRDYALNVSKNGYLFYSDHFSLSGIRGEDDPLIKDIFLKPIRAGESIVMKNIFFDTDKYNLKTQSLIELNKLTQFLAENPAIRIEISGHTDNVGTPVYNMDLSEKRAAAVFQYLVDSGVSRERLQHKGYGLLCPVDTNDTEDGRANNRRTEVKVLKVE